MNDSNTAPESSYQHFTSLLQPARWTKKITQPNSCCLIMSSNEIKWGIIFSLAHRISYLQLYHEDKLNFSEYENGFILRSEFSKLLVSSIPFLSMIEYFQMNNSNTASVPTISQSKVRPSLLQPPWRTIRSRWRMNCFRPMLHFLKKMSTICSSFSWVPSYASFRSVTFPLLLFISVYTRLDLVCLRLALSGPRTQPTFW